MRAKQAEARKLEKKKKPAKKAVVEEVKETQTEQTLYSTNTVSLFVGIEGG